MDAALSPPVMVVSGVVSVFWLKVKPNTRRPPSSSSAMDKAFGMTPFLEGVVAVVVGAVRRSFGQLNCP